ncbi:zinc ribbon domain-containing protein [Companilactobacillus sp.]|uniref:zinc ribbon domain-containing protein n=1 Tax=Companilactobacillus sp. TaxID=2767905 RepID=UPI003456ABF7
MENMKFCPNCGYKMANDIKFCIKCGTKQDMNLYNKNQNTGDSAVNNPDINNFDVNNSVNNTSANQQVQSQPQVNGQQWNSNNQSANGFNAQQQDAGYNNYQNNFNGQYQNNFNDPYQNSNPYGRPPFEPGYAIGQPQHLDFSQSLKYIWENIFDFNPKTQDNQQSIYWYTALMVAIVTIGLTIIQLIVRTFSVDIYFHFPTIYNLISGQNTWFISWIISFILCLLQVPPIMRRLIYLGKNKDLAWLIFVPFANLYILYCMLTRRQ